MHARPLKTPFALLAVVILASAAALPAPGARAESAPESAPASPSFWIPFTATPSAAGGKNGLMVIASNRIEESTPEFITTTPSRFLAIGYQYSFPAAGTVVQTPDILMYSATGADGKIHIYGITLANTANLPTPVQIGSLSLSPATSQICSGIGTPTNLADPTTLFVAIEVGTAGKTGCGVTGTKIELAHYKDSPGTAPVMTTLGSDLFYPLYKNGILKGVVSFDLLKESLILYPSQNFTHPETLFSGVIASPVGLASAKDGNFGDSELFIGVYVHGQQLAVSSLRHHAG